MKRSVVTFILLFTSIFNMVSAQDTERVSDEELETYLQSYAQREIGETLIASDSFKDCYEAGVEYFETLPGNDIEKNLRLRNDNIRDCNQRKFSTLSDEQIEKLAEDFNLEAYDKNAAKSSTSIREYLARRLEKAIYGETRDSEGKLKPLSERQLTDHANFYQLYMEQIGKNTLLLASQYCLENFGYETKHTLLNFTGGKRVTPVNYGIQKVGAEFNLTSSEQVSSTAIGFDGIWKTPNKLREYEVCSTNNCDQTDPQLYTITTSAGQRVKAIEEDNNNKRSTKLIEAIKNANFNLAKDDPQVVARSYNFCAASVIKNMCEIYKCTNIYEETEENKNHCRNNYSIVLEDTPGSNNTTIPGAVSERSTACGNTSSGSGLQLGTCADRQKGQVACNLMEQLRSYRSALNATKEIQDSLNAEDASNRTALSDGIGIKGLYDNSGNDSIDSLTSISSAELTDNVDDIKGAAEAAQALREQCLDNENGTISLKDGAEAIPECQQVMATIDAKGIADIQADTEARTALFLERLGDTETSNKEEFKKFLTENGLGEYLSKLQGEEGTDATLTEDQLRLLIKEDFLTKKNAELDAIKERFRKEMKIASGDGTSSDRARVDVVEQNIGNIEEHKRRVETLFQYSNIVSSYLSVRPAGGAADSSAEAGATANVTGRRLEIGRAREEDTELLGYFSEGSDQTNSSRTSFDYNQVFEAILEDSSESPNAPPP